MKIPASGSKTKKQYYQNDAMQFTIPFLKTSAVLTGNLPTIPSDENVEIIEEWENHSLLDQSNITDSPKTQDQPHSPQMVPLSMPPPPSKSTQSSILYSNLTEQTENQKSTYKITRKKNNQSRVADEAFAEYFQSKRVKMNNSPRDMRTDSIKQFLNSLVPDLLTMNDGQLRTYKKRSIALIDNILGTNPCTSGTDISPETCVQKSPVGSYLSSFSSEDENDKQHYFSL